MASNQQKPSIKWMAKNPITRQHETIDINVDEILPGQSVIKMFLSGDKYVTIPDDCIYRMNENNELVLED